MHVYLCRPGPERFLCSPLRSNNSLRKTHWRDILERRTSRQKEGEQYFYVSRFWLHKAQHKHMCPSCDCVINSLNWACCDFEVTHGRLLWYTAGFSWGTPRDAWKHTHTHTQANSVIHHTHKHTHTHIHWHTTATPGGVVSANTHCYTLGGSSYLWSPQRQWTRKTRCVVVWLCVCVHVCVGVCVCTFERENECVESLTCIKR